MLNIFLILYWILIILIVVVSGIIVFHIWVYYLNKTLAILMISFFSVGIVLLIFLNLAIASKIDWNAINFFSF